MCSIQHQVRPGNCAGSGRGLDHELRILRQQALHLTGAVLSLHAYDDVGHPTGNFVDADGLTDEPAGPRDPPALDKCSADEQALWLRQLNRAGREAHLHRQPQAALRGHFPHDVEAIVARLTQFQVGGAEDVGLRRERKARRQSCP
jgi:hypothetical protein